MPSARILRETNIIRTARVAQVEGIFNIAPSQRSAEKWNISFDLPDQWNVGAIIGPSGSGKTTLVRELFSDYIVDAWEWSENKSVVDGFPRDMSIKDITSLLSMVGFSSPPAWLRPYSVLSNGERFRVHIARTLAEMPELAVVDEFTSVVDRTVAKISSTAAQKAVRKRNQRLIAVSCHYDILDWLEPDWVYQPHTDEYYTGRYLHQRPKIELEIKRVHHSAWQLFRKHHYLDTSLNTAARCFCAFWEDVPVAFSSVLHFPHPKIRKIKREHRTVCLPDYQGCGIGNALSSFVGAMLRGCGYRFQSQTSHPGMIHSRNKNKDWAMIAKPNRKTKSMVRGWKPARQKGASGITSRYRATFEYIGAALEDKRAKSLWNSNTST